MRIVVTGAAGFIGYHLCEALLARGDEVWGVDIVNDYYDPTLKEARLKRLSARDGYTTARLDIGSKDFVELVHAVGPDAVVNLAAQAGVRYSLTNPQAYVDSNLHGFVNVLEACRHANVGHLLYASSSSVYGANAAMPFSVRSNVDHPLSLYAATKKANELMAHTYSHLYRLPTTGLRFFTVYGPWGRPDMALFLFTKAILAGEAIKIFNHGDMSRDFTYVDDIVEGVARLTRVVPEPDPTWDALEPNPSTSNAPYRVFNIGNNAPVPLMEMISLLEECLGIEAKKEMLPMQPGDVSRTYADVQALEEYVGFKPATPLRDGISAFVEWYRDYYGT